MLQPFRKITSCHRFLYQKMLKKMIIYMHKF